MFIKCVQNVYHYSVVTTIQGQKFQMSKNSLSSKKNESNVCVMTDSLTNKLVPLHCDDS